jgi:NAD(P)-dependent dehydrogenase (short-subunit alcohol dehydrogenase family)
MAGLGYEVGEVAKAGCDVRDRKAVDEAIRTLEPNWVINCAGVSDQHGESAELVCATNLLGAINVTEAMAPLSESATASWLNRGVIHIASTAGLIAPRRHAYYAASKAGLIRYVESMGAGGFPVWAVSPGRVDTPMRDADWPNEDVTTRLKPFQVGVVVSNVIAGHYQKGANVVVRKVGTDRIDVFEDMNPWRAQPSRLA